MSLQRRWLLRAGAVLAAVTLVVGAFQLSADTIGFAQNPPPGNQGVPGNPNPVPAGKVGICHATGSSTNPFVFIIVDESAVPAHEAHQEGRDIIGVGSAADCPQGAVTSPTSAPSPAATATPGAGVVATATPVPGVAAATATPVPGVAAATATPVPGVAGEVVPTATPAAAVAGAAVPTEAPAAAPAAEAAPQAQVAGAAVAAEAAAAELPRAGGLPVPLSVLSAAAFALFSAGAWLRRRL